MPATLRSRLGRLALAVALAVVARLPEAEAVAPSQASDGETQKSTDELAAEVRAMFAHAYDGYMRYAFPMDDLRPLTQDGSYHFAEVGNLELEGLERNNYEGIALSFLESMSTLAVLGNVTEFRKAVTWLEDHPRLFDQDVRVNVFEAIIRVLGALLSAHMVAVYTVPELCTWCGTAKGSPLLALAADLGSRILPAFSTSPTDIPFAWVNLRHGVDENETSETNLAGAGTGLLEFAVLSRLTGDDRYETAAVDCLAQLWKMRSPQGLFGTSIDVREGTWRDQHASVGFGTDSYFEYLLKGYILFADPWYWGMFAASYEAIQRFMASGPWYDDVNMMTGSTIQEAFTSLQAFFPGLQVDVGDIGAASASHRAFFNVWERYGLLPERYLHKIEQVHPSMKYYPLRPELAESTFWLYQATRDPYYQQVVGKTMIDDLNRYARVDTGGFAAVRNVETMEKENHQQSFFLSETLKYLYLLYNDSFLKKGHAFVFTTEGHPFPVVPELRNVPMSRRELPPRYRGWCFGADLGYELLGHKCSCLDVRICPAWERTPDDDEEAPAEAADQIAEQSSDQTAESTEQPTELEELALRAPAPLRSEAGVESACHVFDGPNGSACASSKDCGVDAVNCRERLCSNHGFCFTP